MADLYNTVKKQGEQIDDLQKNVSNHTTRIETLETKAMATPPPQLTNPGPIKVELPADIATNTSIRKMLTESMPKSSDSELLRKVVSYLPDATAKAVGKAVADNLNMEVKDTLKEGIRQEFADERKELRDIVSDLRYKTQSIIEGQWWRTIPKWVYILFMGLFLTAVGFGYGFFHELNENSRLTETEWLYRRERTLYRTEKELQLLLNHEKEFFTGTTHEQDSIKDLIRYREQKGEYDKTFLYFNPTEN